MPHTETLETHIINPDKHSVGTVIWMHGLGADNHDFDSLVPALWNGDQLPLRFVFPNAPTRPVAINQNMHMRAWYDIYSLTDLNREDTEGVYASRAVITRLVEDEIEKGVPSNRIVLAGFSQGGAMALYAGLRQSHTLAGIMALSSYLPLIHEHEETTHSANRNTPIFIAHGTHDMTLPLFAGRLGFDSIHQTHPNAEWREYHMQHEIIPEEVHDIHHWLVRVMQG